MKKLTGLPFHSLSWDNCTGIDFFSFYLVLIKEEWTEVAFKDIYIYAFLPV